jgi:phage terminase large subunit-like protein
MLMFGLRLGKDPRVVIATTPRPTPEVKALLAQPGLTLTRGTTYENLDNLAPAFRTAIIARYENTRLGRQELNAELLEDVEGALWQQSWIDQDRVFTVPPLTTVVVAVDPKASANALSESGIVVVGRSIDRQYYILGDYSLDGLPEQWAEAVAFAYEYHEANYVVAEQNNGGDMVKSVLQATDSKLPVELVWASRGKQTRAEPVVALYQQHKVHHVGVLPGLEDQLCSWVPSEGPSPDRGDALVWGVTKLMDPGTATVKQNKVRGRGGGTMVRRSVRRLGRNDR